MGWGCCIKIGASATSISVGVTTSGVMEPLPENFKAPAQAPSGLGVAILRERILEAGGSFEIESLPGGIVVGAAVPRKALGPKDLITEKSTKAPEGATAGAGSGVLIGGALGWLAGIGALALPGLGPFIAAGPIMASLAGLGRRRRWRHYGRPDRRWHSGI